MRIFSILALFAFSAITGYSNDTIKLVNPSFEDIPTRGVDNFYLPAWFDCGKINFPKESPPDVHPNDYWENRKQPFHGRTYVGLVTRDNDTYEAIAQRLDQPLESGSCYEFSIYLSKSERYKSGSKVRGIDDPVFNYTYPTVLRIWGGSGYCDTKELLAESSVVDHSEWEEYQFKLSPTFNIRTITFEAFYKTPIIVPTNGHILIDNCSAFVNVPCKDEIAVAETKNKVPPHKRKKKPAPKPAIEKPKKEDVAAADQVSKPKIMKDLDRKTIKKGQVLPIQQLFFTADTSKINEESYEVLDEIYDFLVTNNDIQIEIGGHTNGVPPHKYCDRLSTERAKAVATYLVKKGIPAGRLEYKGYGKRKPIANNKTSVGRKKNQRVEIKILNIG